MHAPSGRKRPGRICTSNAKSIYLRIKPGEHPAHAIVRHTAPFLAARLAGSLQSAPAFRYSETPCLWGATLLHLKDARASVVQQDTLGVCCQ